MMQRVLNRLKSETARFFVRRNRTVAVPGGLISFTFDDFPKSAYRQGGAVLGSHGAAGTYYVAMGLRDAESEMGPHFSSRDLQELVAAGHELGCHTYSHLDCRISDGDTVAQETGDNVQALSRVLGSYTLRSFAFPFGRVALPAKRALTHRFEACRTIRPGINAGRVDFNLLNANCLYSRAGDLDAVGNLIRLNRESGGWLIFYTHDVTDRPSPYGCTPGYFEAVVRAAVTSGSKVLTVGAALDELNQRNRGVV